MELACDQAGHSGHPQALVATVLVSRRGLLHKTPMWILPVGFCAPMAGQEIMTQAIGAMDNDNRESEGPRRFF